MPDGDIYSQHVPYGFKNLARKAWRGENYGTSVEWLVDRLVRPNCQVLSDMSSLVRQEASQESLRRVLTREFGYHESESVRAWVPIAVNEYRRASEDLRLSAGSIAVNIIADWMVYQISVPTLMAEISEVERGGRLLGTRDIGRIQNQVRNDVRSQLGLRRLVSMKVNGQVGDSAPADSLQLLVPMTQPATTAHVLYENIYEWFGNSNDASPS